MFIIVLAISLFNGNFATADTIILTPQSVVEKTLEKGLEKQKIELDAQKSELQIGQAESVFDSGMGLSTNYSITQNENLSGFANIEDRTFFGSIGYQKRFSTGTSLTARIEQTQQSSILNPNFSAIRPDTVTQYQTIVEVKQNLINNGFGKIDRNNLKKAKLSVEAAYLNSDEQLEDLVLQTLQAYWVAYVAKESLTEAIEARKLIEDLEKTVRRKARIGNASPGELPRIQAELEFQQQRVKQTSVDFLNAVDQLKNIMNIPLSTEVELSVENELPPLPKKQVVEIEKNRQVIATEKNINIADINIENSESTNKPELTLDFTYNSTGVDEDNDLSFAEMASATKPFYFVGLNLKFFLNSSLTQATLVNDRVNRMAAETQRQMTINQLKLMAEKAYRDLQALYQIAESTKKTVGLRERAAKDMDRAFKQGRLDLNSLITGYRELFSERVKKAQAYGNYRIAINRYAELKDQLIEPEKIKRN